jgi:hypothetical protein
MKHNHLISSLLAAGALMGLGTAAQAVPAVVAPSSPSVVIQQAPPAPMYEIQPASRDGYVWSPGFYDWRDGRYVWISGQWIEDRPGYEWRESRWVQRRDGSWQLIAGGWVRDDYASYDDDDERDRDRRERSRRFGPYGDIDRDGVLNQDDNDRDGDGVRNRWDDYPNNPNRS